MSEFDRTNLWKNSKRSCRKISRRFLDFAIYSPLCNLAMRYATRAVCNLKSACFIFTKDSNVFCRAGQAFGKRTDISCFVLQLCKILKPVYDFGSQVPLSDLGQSWHFVTAPFEVLSLSWFSDSFAYFSGRFFPVCWPVPGKFRFLRLPPSGFCLERSVD